MLEINQLHRLIDEGKHVSSREIGSVSVLRTSDFLFDALSAVTVAQIPLNGRTGMVDAELRVSFTDPSKMGLLPSSATVFVISSESQMNGFDQHGKKFLRYTPAEWIRDRCVVLDGLWADQALVADAVVQLGLYQGVLFEMNQFFTFARMQNPYVEECVRRAWWPVLDNRKEFYAWVERGMKT